MVRNMVVYGLVLDCDVRRDNDQCQTIAAKLPRVEGSLSGHTFYVSV